MTTAKNDVLLGYTLVGGGGGELTFVGGIKIWRGGGSLLGGFFQISGGLALFWLVGGGEGSPHPTVGKTLRVAFGKLVGLALAWLKMIKYFKMISNISRI